MGLPLGYAKATRHPWPCLLFVLPLLLAYEGGVGFLGGQYPETIRNGADHWLRCALGFIGIRFFWVPPLVLAVAFVSWAWARWKDRPTDLLGILSGMVLESVAFAIGLWALSRVLAPLLQHAGIELAVPFDAAPTLSALEPTLKQVVTYLGAGIYEEAVFRLVLFSLLMLVLRKLEMSWLLSVAFAAGASATLFSLAHHLGPYGQTYSNYLFLFRLLAGVYFALLYETRGFGIAVGTHACYNVMVSVT